MQKKNSTKRITGVKLSNVVKKPTPKKSKLWIDPTIKKGEIILAKITYNDKDRKFNCEEVYKKPSDTLEPFTEHFKNRFEKRHKVKVEDIVRVDIIARTGFEHKGKKFHKAIKSEEKRDSKTGKYD